MNERGKNERELTLEAAELTSCDQETSVVLCDTFLYEPDVGEEALGSLFLVAETVNLPMISGGAPRGSAKGLPSDEVAEPTTKGNAIAAISSAVREEHYKDPARDLLRSFEAALSAANAALASYAKRGENDWLENLHAAIGTFRGTTLHVSRTGAAEILLVRHGRLTDIGEGLSDRLVRHPQHVFTNIASGTLSEQDVLVLTSPQLLRIVPRDRLAAFLTGKSPKDAAMYVRDLLAESADQTSFAALFLRAARAPIALPIPRQTDEAPASVRPRSEQSGPVRSPLRAPRPLAPFPRNTSRTPIRLRLTAPQRALTIGKRIGALLVYLVATRAGPAVARASKVGLLTAKAVVGKTARTVTSRFAAQPHNAAFGERSPSPAAPLKEPPHPVSPATSRISARLRSALGGWPTSTKIFFLTTLIFAVLSSGSFVLLKRKRVEEAAIRAASEQLEEARTKQQAADAALIYGNTDEARQHLQTARERARAVERTPYYAAQATEILRRIQEVEDKTERITRVPEPVLVGDLGSVIPSGRALGLQAIGEHLFAFSPDTNAILRLAVDQGETSVVSQTSEGIGYFKSTAPLAAERMLLFATDTPGLALFDTARGDLSKQELAGLPEGTKEIKALATFGSRLYLLLPEARQIYGFSKTLAGYTGAAPWLKDTQVPVERAVSMGVDGYIYLLTNDGKIVKLLKGSPVEFSQSVLTRPLEAPSKLIANETLKHLYVLDPPQKRVIVYDTTGILTQQFVFPSARDLRDIAIGGKEETLYVLDETAVYRVPLK